MHSIYSGFRLRRMLPQANASTGMQYRVTGVADRFRLLRIEVTGACLVGTIEAFFRPRPVVQRSISEISAVVSSDAFLDHRVLIVGGSRGLGELTAKILLAGHADVTITYFRGKRDAEKICDEARALGLVCSAQHMDVTTMEGQGSPEWLATSCFSHVYFFATPPISKNQGDWSASLYDQFHQTYVAGFKNLVEQTLATRADRDRSVHFLYPSSVFLTKPEIGFGEYAAAKAAGEALCDKLQGSHGARFTKPRLPRMQTDQTNSLVDTGAADPLSILLDVIRNAHS
jgi:NADP-dependent 3-hydroxy acid dehydrogenase YdfG